LNDVNVVLYHLDEVLAVVILVNILLVVNLPKDLLLWRQREGEKEGGREGGRAR